MSPAPVEAARSIKNAAADKLRTGNTGNRRHASRIGDTEHIAEIRAATNGNYVYVFGNNRFKEEISRMLKSL